MRTDELRLNIGDHVSVISEFDDGWAIGTVIDGKNGRGRSTLLYLITHYSLLIII